MDPSPFELNNLRFFVAVVDRQGFTAAADSLSVPKSRVSRLVSDLEASLGTRLLQRNSRKLVLTEAGSEFYGYCVAILEQAHLAHVAMQHRVGAVTGTLRISVSVAVADMLLTEALPSFVAMHPQVKIFVQATNRTVDLIQERIDIAVRGMKAAPESSELVQSRICTVRWGLFASPSYLARKLVRTVEDLEQVDALMYRALDESDTSWTLYGADDRELRQRTNVHLQSDNMAVIKSVALSGAGIGELPLYACRDELASGALAHVLPEFRPRFGRLVLLFPSRRGMTPTARRFADHLRSTLFSLLHPNERIEQDEP